MSLHYLVISENCNAVSQIKRKPEMFLSNLVQNLADADKICCIFSRINSSQNNADVFYLT